MKAFPALSLALALSLLAAPLCASEFYRGRVQVRGEVQSQARPGSVSVVFIGQLRERRTGRRANASGGGLFRSNDDEAVNRIHRGRLRTLVRTANSPTGVRGRLVRRSINARVRVTSRIVAWPGGRLVLPRPLNPNREEPQRFRGLGTFRIRI